MVDMQDVTVLWLPGGVTGYVDVNKDGILCIGVGWYADEGINLVMERDYGLDGMLKEVRWKSELKRRWSDPHLMVDCLDLMLLLNPFESNKNIIFVDAQS
ncbi:hypothetical protein GH714_039332 [Hevea brasiliensis]|uniref:Uncharacterized protein n=1 Tax=Hevea brasiliensis TaxID=3981 RepID=A0A6A6MP95_HEVBR|nr:hypothetical protein GH714_039332 [Hevea brasiliensis]